MKLKSLLIHDLLDCFDRKYNLRACHGSHFASLNISRTRPAQLRSCDMPDHHSHRLGLRLAKKTNET
jgi:hypothetical protein